MWRRASENKEGGNDPICSDIRVPKFFFILGSSKDSRRRLVTVIFEGVAIGVGEIDCVSAASAFNLDFIFLKLLFQGCKCGLGRLEAEVLQRIIGGDPFLGADEINQVLTPR